MITDTFVTLTDRVLNGGEFTIDSGEMAIIERFIVVAYSNTCSCATVNEARRELYQHNLKSLDAIPPTQADLFQHTRRALLQVIIWAQSLSAQQVIPETIKWGARVASRRGPLWASPGSLARPPREGASPHEATSWLGGALARRLTASETSLRGPIYRQRMFLDQSGVE